MLEATAQDSERIDYEVRRVAAAFGMLHWEINDWGGLWMISGIGERGAQVRCGIIASDARCMGIRVGNDSGDECEIYEKAPTLWVCRLNPMFNEVMARGLYRLGFDNKFVLDELNYPLSQHERAELRLTMPQKFWPTEWSTTG